MSAIGTKRTSAFALHMSAFGGKADNAFLHCICPLMTQSGHSLTSNEIDAEEISSPHYNFLDPKYCDA